MSLVFMRHKHNILPYIRSWKPNKTCLVLICESYGGGNGQNYNQNFTRMPWMPSTYMRQKQNIALSKQKVTKGWQSVEPFDFYETNKLVSYIKL
jgi:hypothetical protein